MVPFERSFSKLSENPEIIEIGYTELKLRRLKVFLLHGSLDLEYTSYRTFNFIDKSSVFLYSALTAAPECWNSLQPSLR